MDQDVVGRKPTALKNRDTDLLKYGLGGRVGHVEKVCGVEGSFAANRMEIGFLEGSEVP